MQRFCQAGDLAIVTAAIRDEGTTRHYLPVEFPAVANVDVVDALRTAAARTGARTHLGVCQTKDSFYGELEPERMPVSAWLHERWATWVAGGAICSEMEAAAIFTIASIKRVRAGGVMVMAGNLEMSKEELEAGIASLTLDALLRTAIDALRILIERDRRAA
jgi:uridine phosphorylase